jgi:uncharacterized tellurite resistance protein B-like protein
MAILSRIKAWLLDPPAKKKIAARTFAEHEVAIAALLVEAARMDGTFDDGERRTILGLLERRFALEPAEAIGLLAVGEARQRQSNEVFKFALAARQVLDEEQRVELMEMLWETVLSDGILHDFEGSLMRRIAGLLHVPDVASGEARKRAQARLDRAQGGRQGDEA